MNVAASRSRRGRRAPASLRAAAASILALLGSLLLLPASPAHAEEAKFVADKSSWFWSSNERVTICTRSRFGQDGVCHRAAGTDVVNPVSTGHIAVSMKDGSSDMRSYIHFDDTVIAGAQVTKYVVVLNVSRGDHASRHSQVQEKPPATINEGAAAIQACAVSEFFADGSEGDPPYSTKVTPGAPETPDPSDDETEIVNTRNEPTFDCGLNAEGKPNSDGSQWRFDITNIAQKWASLERFDEGIALIPMDKGIKPTWTIEFHGAPREKAQDDENFQVVTKAEAGRAEVEFAAAPPPPPPPPPIDPGPNLTGTVTLPPTTGGEVTTPSDTTVDPGTQTPAPTTGVPVAAFQGKTPAWFWILILLSIIGVGLMSTLIGGDPLTATVAGASMSRVASVLRGRRLSGGEALEAAQTIEAEEIATQE